jgi:hypothetical protein
MFVLVYFIFFIITVLYGERNLLMSSLLWNYKVPSQLYKVSYNMLRLLKNFKIVDWD